jgi:hypothetical protein
MLGAIHARIPMVTLDEMRVLKRESAVEDERFASSWQSYHADNAAGHKRLIAGAEKAVAESTALMDELAANAAAAKDRIARLDRGEDVEGGLFVKPLTTEEFLKSVG